MTSLILGGAVNAFMFAGVGWFFSKLNKHDYETKIKRHNKALGDVANANKIKNDRIQKLRMQLFMAKEHINRKNKALDELRSVQTIRYDGHEFNREPQLSDFYQPSNEMWVFDI